MEFYLGSCAEPETLVWFARLLAGLKTTYILPLLPPPYPPLCVFTQKYFKYKNGLIVVLWKLKPALFDFMATAKNILNRQGDVDMSLFHWKSSLCS